MSARINDANYLLVGSAGVVQFDRLDMVQMFRVDQNQILRCGKSIYVVETVRFILALKVILLDQLQGIICSVIQEP